MVPDKLAETCAACRKPLPTGHNPSQRTRDGLATVVPEPQTLGDATAWPVHIRNTITRLQSKKPRYGASDWRYHPRGVQTLVRAGEKTALGMGVRGDSGGHLAWLRCFWIRASRSNNASR